MYKNIKNRTYLISLLRRFFRQVLPLSQDTISPWMTEAFWVGFGLATSVLALFAGTCMLTTLLSTIEYGRLVLAISLAMLVVQICGEPVAQTAVRFYAHWREAGKLPVLIHSLKKSMIWTVGGIFLTCIAIVVLGRRFDELPSDHLTLIVGAFAAFLILNRVAVALEDAARERRFRGIMQGGFELGRFLFAIGLIFFLASHRAETALDGFLIAAILTVAAHGLFLWKILKPLPGEQYDIGVTMTTADAISLRRFQFPLFISHAFIWLVMMTERWLLHRYGSLADVGGYAAVYQLAFMPMIFVSKFLVLLTEPIIYQMTGLDRETDSGSNALRINGYLAVVILLMTLIIFSLLLFCHPVVGRFLLGIEFRTYSWLFPWLFLAGGFFAAAQQFLVRMKCDMRTGTIAVLWGVVALIAAFAYFIGAKYWQLTGILTAVVLVNGILFLSAIIFTGPKKSV